MKKNEVFYRSLKITLLYVGVGSLNLLLLKSDSIFVSIIAIQGLFIKKDLFKDGRN